MNVLSFLSKLLKPLLIPFSLLYGLIIWLRNKVYDTGIYAGIEFSIPVISVGNLSTGGTGKTPHIEYLVQLLQYEYKIATLSRGYKRKTRGFRLADKEANAAIIGDEPMQFHHKFPELIVSVAEERMTAIPELMRRHPEIEVILLDDAYQHRSVKPGLNILITDYNKPFYKDFILPFGSLRESRSTYKRADIIIVSKCPEQLPAEARMEIENQIRPYPYQKVFFSTVRYDDCTDYFLKTPTSITPNTNIVLISGIAKPAPLLAYLKGLASDVHLLNYPDHHYFSHYDLREIKETVDTWKVNNKVIATTEKDAVRLDLHREKLSEWGIKIIVIPIKIAFLSNNKETFDRLVLNYIEEERKSMENLY